MQPRLCTVCGREVPDVIASDRCTNCYSVERRLRKYLEHGGEKALEFVWRTIEKVEQGAAETPTPELPPPPPSGEELGAIEEATTGIRRMETFK